MSRGTRIALGVVLGVATSLGSLGCDNGRIGPANDDHVELTEPLATEVVGKVARSAFRLKSGEAGTTTVDVTAAAAGPLDVFLARRAPAAGRAVVTATLQCRDWGWLLARRAAPSCRIAWAPHTESARWRRCRMQLAHACSQATLEIALRAGADAHIVASKPEIPLAPRPDAPNVFFFVVDTVRADRLRPFSNVVPIGSNLARLGRRSLVFTRARSTTSWTRPAVASMLTGLRADTHGVHNRPDVLNERIPTLPQWLRDHGFYTVAFSANPNILPVWGFDKGFDEFHDINSSTWANAKPEASELVDRLIDSLEAHAGRAGFYYVHMMDAHAPYKPSAEDRARVNAIPQIGRTFPQQPMTPQLLSESSLYFDYLGELVDIDRQIGRFVRHLRDTGRFAHSTIVFVSDHGEEFLDHGLKYHGTGLFEEVLRAVLLIKAPKAAAVYGTVDAVVGVEDVAPTVLEILGIESSAAMDGASLVQPRQERAVSSTGDASSSAGLAIRRLRTADWLREPARPGFATLKLDKSRVSSVIVEPWKLIQYHHADSALLYNLADDPHEKNELSKSNPAKLAELRALLAAEGARHDAGWHVLACGGTSQTPIAMRLAAPGNALATRSIESGDRVTVDESAPATSAGILLELPMIEKDVESLGQMTKLRDQDNDELLLTPSSEAASAPKLTARASMKLRYTLGTGKVLQEAAEIDLSAVADQATTTGAEWVECPISETDLAGVAIAMEVEPYLRIWRVPGATTMQESEVDPKVTERLRGLGYAW